MSNKNKIARKIPIESLIAVLIDLYQKGADYVDLAAGPTSEDNCDRLIVMTKDEYIKPEYRDSFKTGSDDHKIDDEDIEKLL